MSETLQTLKESFFKFENVCKAVGLSKNDEAVDELDDFVIDIAKHGVSVIAIDKETNKVIGVSLNKIQHKDTSCTEFYADYAKRAQHAETIAILDFLTEMEGLLDPFTPYNADCLLESVFLGVQPEYGGRGIGTTLFKITLDLASLLYKGQNVKISLEESSLPLEPIPQIVTSILTTFKTQQITKRLGFDLIKKIYFKDVYFNGRSYGSLLRDDNLYFTLECKKIE